MQQPVETPSAQPMEGRPERPPNHLVRAIVLLLILAPLCLLVGGSSAYATLSILTGPPVISETPVWLRALMESLRVVVALISLYMPLAALGQAVKVNSEYNRGNYGGAIKASKAAAANSRQSLILLVVILLIMGADLMRYAASGKD